MNVNRGIPSPVVSGSLLPAILLLASLVPSIARANEVTDWNQVAAATLRKPDWTLLRRERALAMTQIAVYEAANACSPRYMPSMLAVSAAPGASLPAALTEAAYRVLVSLVPEETASLTVEREKHLAAVPDSPAKNSGIDAGAKAAQSILAWRKSDGADYASTYHPGSGPGAYQPTSDAPMEEPLIGTMKPFAMATASQFRPGAPPALDSVEYRRDLEEVKTIGGMHSSVRTADQTDQGKFFRSPGVWPWTEITRDAIAAHHFDEVDSARALALVDTAIMDAHLSSWEAKYVYNFWRPVTAIHTGVGLTGGQPDLAWTPLIATPMIPEYTCAHCCLGSAASTVLDAVFGKEPFAFEVTSNEITRQFHSFDDYAEQEGNGRIFGGVHFRFSLKAGDEAGRKIGQLVIAQAAKPMAGKLK